MHSEKDKEKLKLLYGKYKNRMYITACKVLGDPQRAEDAVHDAFIAVACKVLGDPQRAEDAVHDAFIAVSKHIDKIDDVNSVSTGAYMIKAARSRALNIVRMGLPEKETVLDEAEAKADESLLDEICRKESYNEIVTAILSLEEKYRDVLTLYYLNDLSLSEIAELQGVKENTVKQQLFRGRRKLINTITKEDETNEKRQSHA